MPKQKTKKSVKKVISSGRKVPWKNLVKLMLPYTVLILYQSNGELALKI